MKKTLWSDQESKELEKLYNKRPLHITMRGFIRDYLTTHTGRNEDSITSHISREKSIGRFMGGAVGESPFVVYDTPLIMTGDALILNDLHCPYHHAEFINQCIQTAKIWGIDNCIIGGDICDNKALSAWGEDFAELEPEGLDENTSQELHDYAMTLKGKARDGLINILEKKGVYEKEETNIDIEMKITGEVFTAIASQFKSVDVCMGNHDNRVLRRLGKAITPETYQKMIGIKENPAWRFSNYYYTELQSGGKKWLIEHPNLSGKFSAWQLASKKLCNVVMAHNHQVNWAFDRSGTYWAIESGCCADVSRIEYSEKRHSGGHAQAMGAVIVRDGYPYMLTQNTDWEWVQKR